MSQPIFQIPSKLIRAGSRMLKPNRILAMGGGGRIGANRACYAWCSTASRQSDTTASETTEPVVGNNPLGWADVMGVDQDLMQRDPGGSATAGRLVTLRTFLVHALKIQSPVLQLDLKAAFRHLLLHQQTPEGNPRAAAPSESSGSLDVSIPSRRCQAMAAWLLDHQLVQSNADPCLYLGRQFHVFFLHDSVLILGNSDKFKAEILAPRFASGATDLLHEVETVLGIQITRRREEDGDQDTLYLSQSKLISKALKELKGLDESAGGQEAQTPLTPKLHLPEADEWEHKEFMGTGKNYRQSVGQLTQIGSTTRPDISYASSYLSQFAEKPGMRHWAQVSRCWQYLQATQHKALRLRISPQAPFALEIWSDANWAGDLSSRASQSGYLACLHGACVSWNSARQLTVSLSSTESEMRALVEATQELIWLQRLVKELNTLSPSSGSSNQTLPPDKLSHMNYIDNHSLACLLANNSFHSKTKHIDVHTKWLRQHVNNHVLTYQWIPTSNMIADCLTKPAPKSSYSLLCDEISLL